MMNASNGVSRGINMTQTPLNSGSNKISNNVDPNFVTQALTNACIIVPVVCFVGTVMTVILGVTMCKINWTCDRCALLRIFHDRSEEHISEATRPVSSRPLPNGLRESRTSNRRFQNHNRPDLGGVSNPSFVHSDLNLRSGYADTIRTETFRSVTGSEVNSVSSNFSTDDISKIANYDSSSAREMSFSSSDCMYRDRINKFLADSFPTCHHSYREAFSSGFNKGSPPYFSGCSSSVTLSTFFEGSSFSEYEMSSFKGSSFFENRPLSDVSRIVHYSRSLLGNSSGRLPLSSENLPADSVEPQAVSAAQINVSSDSEESLNNTCIRAPPPSPTIDNLSDCTEMENPRCSNESLTSPEVRQQSDPSERGNQDWLATLPSEEINDHSLEWDNYQSSLLGNFFCFGTSCPEASRTFFASGDTAERY